MEGAGISVFDKKPGKQFFGHFYYYSPAGAPDICALTKTENVFRASDRCSPLWCFGSVPVLHSPKSRLIQLKKEKLEYTPGEHEHGLFPAPIHVGGYLTCVLIVGKQVWHWGACTACASLWFLSLARSPVAFGPWTLPTHPSVFPSLTQEVFFSLKHELCSGFFVCQKMPFWLKTCFNCGNPWMKCRAIVPTSKENYSRVATDDYDQLLNPKSWAWSDKFPHVPMHLMVSVFKQG